MLSIHLVFLKTFVRTFYKQHSGFFLFLFFLLFGLVSPAQLFNYHYSLMRGMITSPLFLAVVMTLWLGYGFKCSAFVRQCLEKPENTFLHVFEALTVKNQWVLLLAIQLLLYAPVLIYAALVSIVAISLNQTLVAVTIIFFLLIINLWGAYRIRQKWESFYRGNEGMKFFSFRFIDFVRPYYLYLLAYTWNDKKFSLLMIKAFSFLCLHLILALPEKHFDALYLPLMFLLIAQAHSFLIYNYQKFAESRLSFIRNLPKGKASLLMTFMTSYLVLFVPEFFFLIIRETFTLGNILLSLGLVIGQLMLMTGLLYLQSLRMKTFLKMLTAVFLIFLFVTIQHPLLSMLLAFMGGIGIFYWGYDRWERVAY
jgi:hypothetical protein